MNEQEEKQLASALETLNQARENSDQSFAELRERVGKLEETNSAEHLAESALRDEIATLTNRKMIDYSPEDRAAYLAEELTGLSNEDIAILMANVGKGELLKEVAEPEGEDDDDPDDDPDEDVEEEPNIIQGKTDKPGYHYHETLDISVKDKTD